MARTPGLTHLEDLQLGLKAIHCSSTILAMVDPRTNKPSLNQWLPPIKSLESLLVSDLQSSTLSTRHKKVEPSLYRAPEKHHVRQHTVTLI